MNCVVKSKKQMGLKTELACLSLLLLVLLLLETACFAEGYGKIGRFKGGSGSVLGPVKSQSGFKGNAHKDGDEVFGVEKRKVYTGPNPLHNR
ncbi:hypothetical protein FNV43_RR16077 [Rhamnella rubrinervis]|uniref:Uncharacterized protein n=1 Tax=Rhamnella rubrinervis TaxID=2594499 RepID=A0A8K0E4P2_9ROSA|nr:hypothetical protein FNV43_RR16077 [Rhamnella rubrinervis]